MAKRGWYRPPLFFLFGIVFGMDFKRTFTAGLNNLHADLKFYSSCNINSKHNTGARIRSIINQCNSPNIHDVGVFSIVSHDVAILPAAIQARADYFGRRIRAHHYIYEFDMCIDEELINLRNGDPDNYLSNMLISESLDNKEQ